MATIIGIPPYTGADKVDVSIEPITTLNGGGVALQHAQRFIFSIRPSAGVAVDLPGDAAFGLDVDIRRLPIATTVTRVSVAVDAVNGAVLKAANTARNGMQIYNHSTRTLIGVYDNTSTVPVVAPFTFRVGPGGYWEMPVPIYQGAVTGIWDGAETDATKTGANITESA